MVDLGLKENLLLGRWLLYLRLIYLPEKTCLPLCHYAILHSAMHGWQD